MCVSIQVCMYICVDACSYLCMDVCMYVLCIYAYVFRYECDVCMNAYAYTFVLYILCSEIMTESKKYGRMTCSRCQHTYFIRRRSRVDISAHILIIVVIFFVIYISP